MLHNNDVALGKLKVPWRRVPDRDSRDKPRIVPQSLLLVKELANRSESRRTLRSPGLSTPQQCVRCVKTLPGPARLSLSPVKTLSSPPPLPTAHSRVKTLRQQYGRGRLVPAPPDKWNDVKGNRFSITQYSPSAGRPGLHQYSPVILKANQNTRAGSWTTEQGDAGRHRLYMRCKMEAAGLQKLLSGQSGLSLSDKTTSLSNVVGSRKICTSPPGAAAHGEMGSSERPTTSRRC